jgi:hypothetical protein
MDCCGVDNIENSRIDDLPITVELKATTNPIPLCYCFGFDENYIREEIAQTGTTTVPQRITQLIREGLCACDVLNPSGTCCLGAINRTATRLKREVVEQV